MNSNGQMDVDEKGGVKKCFSIWIFKFGANYSSCVSHYLSSSLHTPYSIVVLQGKEVQKRNGYLRFQLMVDWREILKKEFSLFRCVCVS